MGSISPSESSELLRTQWEELDPVFMLHTSERGINAELKGIEVINGVKYHVISFYREGSINMSCYFDFTKETLSMSKSTIAGPDGPITTTTLYNKYVEYEKGLLFPIEVITTVGAEKMSTRLSYVTLNPDIDPEIFIQY